MKITITIIPSDYECVEWAHWHDTSINQFIATTWEEL